MRIYKTTEFINEKLGITPVTKERLTELKDYIPPITANDSNIHKLVRDAIKKYGNNANLNFIDTFQVTNMAELFKDTKFNGDISKWDVSEVENMEG